ncbi:MAG TPA: L,D-transpeptidase family protein [Solirubrobacteraceae bacterium]|nr:L,D-transpeptidase family protein [Solirubrobacteraceae bacterium]
MPRIAIISIATLALLLAGAGAVFAYDSSRSDVIAKGVTIGDIDVGGLSATDAKQKVTESLLQPLQEPLVITAEGKTYPLSAREAHIRANLESMIDDAVDRSREGGVLARTWRGITGADVNARVAPDIEYSRDAVQRIVDRVRVAVSRKAQDAKVDFAPDSLSIRPARTGKSIDARLLRTKVENALVAATGNRALDVPVQTVQPKVTGAGLADRYPVVLTVDRGNFRLSLFKKLKRERVYPIAVGQAGLETPAGLYKIQNKAVNPAWHVPNSDWAGALAGTVIPGGTPANPIKARWLGVYDGVGVHGTDARGSIGSNASHGCIRMLIEDVEKLYDEVPVGTPIFIH